MIYYLQSTIALSATLFLCLRAVPERSTARWLATSALLVGGIGWWLVFFGETGTLTKYTLEYRVQTSSFFAALCAGLFTAGYAGRFYGWWEAKGPLFLGLYLAGDVAANALYRWTEYVYDFQRMLVQGVHLWHLVVLVVSLGVRNATSDVRSARRDHER